MNITHPLSYYKNVLIVLIEGVRCSTRYEIIAVLMNRAGITTATGSEFTTETVRDTLKSIRRRTGPHYRAMLELVFSGDLTAYQCKPLFAHV